MNKTCILVLGMHRSGTSAFTGILNILGISLGRNVLEGNEDNEKGFFENKKIYEFHDYELLPVLNSSWDDTNYLKKDWHTDKALEPFYVKAKDIILNEYNTNELFSIKDPRICFLFPFWEKVFDELNIKLKIILPLRNPLEVSASLFKRNGFKTDKSLTLWSKYVLYAEFYSRKYERVFVHYDNLLSSTYNCIKEIQDTLSLDDYLGDESITKKLEKFLDKNLKHNACTDNELKSVPEFISTTFEKIYLVLNKNEIKEDPLDRARQMYETCCDFLIDSQDKEQKQRAYIDLKEHYDQQNLTMQGMLAHTDNLKKEISQRIITSQSLKEEIKERTKVAQNQEIAMQSMSDNAKSLKLEIQERIKVTKNQEDAMKQMHQNTTSLKNEISERIKVMESLNKQILNQQEHIKHQQSHIENQKKHIEECSQELNSILRSRSWKVVKPFYNMKKKKQL